MIVWLEDRQPTIDPQLRTLETLNIEHQVLPTLTSFVSFIEEGCEDKRDSGLFFVLDVMLHGVLQLDDIGIKNAPTMNGTLAGYVFADRYLRGAQSKWKDVRLAFYTEQETSDLEEKVGRLNSIDSYDFKVFQKYNDQHYGEFEVLMQNISTKIWKK